MVQWSEVVTLPSKLSNPILPRKGWNTVSRYSACTYPVGYVRLSLSGLPPWLVVPVLLSRQSPLWIRLANALHFRLHSGALWCE